MISGFIIPMKTGRSVNGPQLQMSTPCFFVDTQISRSQSHAHTLMRTKPSDWFSKVHLICIGFLSIFLPLQDLVNYKLLTGAKPNRLLSFNKLPLEKN